MYHPETAILICIAAILLLLSILALPLTPIYLHYRLKRKRRDALRVEYERAVAIITSRVENCLDGGLAVSMEVWELPPADTAAEMFFDLLEKTVVKTGKGVIYSGECTKAKIAENRLRRFNQGGLLADAESSGGIRWTIELQKIGGNPDLFDHSIDLRHLMATALSLHRKLILNGSR